MPESNFENMNCSGAECALVADPGINQVLADVGLRDAWLLLAAHLLGKIQTALCCRDCRKLRQPPSACLLL